MEDDKGHRLEATKQELCPCPRLLGTAELTVDVVDTMTL